MSTLREGLRPRNINVADREEQQKRRKTTVIARAAITDRDLENRRTEESPSLNDTSEQDVSNVESQSLNDTREPVVFNEESSSLADTPERTVTNKDATSQDDTPEREGVNLLESSFVNEEFTGRALRDCGDRMDAQRKLNRAAMKGFKSEVREQMKLCFYRNGLHMVSNMDELVGIGYHVLESLQYLELVPLHEAQCKDVNDAKLRDAFFNTMKSALSMYGREFRSKVNGEADVMLHEDSRPAQYMTAENMDEFIAFIDDPDIQKLADLMSSGLRENIEAFEFLYEIAVQVTAGFKGELAKYKLHRGNVLGNRIPIELEAMLRAQIRSYCTGSMFHDLNAKRTKDSNLDYVVNPAYASSYRKIVKAVKDERAAENGLKTDHTVAKKEAYCPDTEEDEDVAFAGNRNFHNKRESLSAEARNMAKFLSEDPSL